MLPWSLVLASGLIHALWNLKVKQVENRSLFLAAAYFFAGMVMLPAAVAMGGLSLPGPAVLPVLLSAVAESAYVLTLSKAYAVSDISFVYPIARGSGPVWAAAAGVVFFAERLSTPGALGIALIITGIAAASFNTKKRSAGALLLSLLVGTFIGTYTCLDRLALEYTSLYPLLFWKFIVAGAILLTVHSRRENLANSVKENLGGSFLAGISILTAYFLVVYAMQYSNLGYVAVGRESGIAFAVVFGAVFLKEKLDRRRIVGAIIIFTGIIVLRFA